MKTSSTLSNAIINLLILCSLSVTARASCPALLKSNSSQSQIMSQRYESWLKRYGRQYKDEEEWKVRFNICRTNVEFIECFNAENHSYKLRDNKFADLTNEEFTRTYLGFQRRRHLKTKFRYDEVEDLPRSIDWRKKGAVSRMKDQGRCGKVSCNYNCIV